MLVGFGCLFDWFVFGMCGLVFCCVRFVLLCSLLLAVCWLRGVVVFVKVNFGFV